MKYLLLIFFAIIAFGKVSAEEEPWESFQLKYHDSDPSNDEKDIIVFVHGWPDSYKVWDESVQHYSKKYRCVRIELPNYGGKGKNDLDWGIPLEEIPKKIKTVVQKLTNKKVHLIGHDWGAIFSFRLTRDYPELFTSFTALDVTTDVRPNIFEMALIAWYQLTVMSAFFINRLFPYPVARDAADKIVQILVRILKVPRDDINNVTAQMGYPYYYLWRGRLQGEIYVERDYIPSMPTLFLFGKNKKVNFHVDSFVEAVNEKKNSKAVGLDCEHWIMFDKNYFSIQDEFLNQF